MEFIIFAGGLACVAAAAVICAWHNERTQANQKRHAPVCMEHYPECPCNSCIKDNADSEGHCVTPCCVQHGVVCGGVCPDYLEER